MLLFGEAIAYNIGLDLVKYNYTPDPEPTIDTSKSKANPNPDPAINSTKN